MILPVAGAVNELHVNLVEEGKSKSAAILIDFPAAV